MKHHHQHLHLNLHFHLHHRDRSKEIPKGCVAILVGLQGQEQQRFVIPVIHVNHPLFVQLLKDAEDEYGFHHHGPISIPCPPDHFRTLLHAIIHHHTSASASTSHHHLHLPLSCFTPSSH